MEFNPKATLPKTNSGGWSIYGFQSTKEEQVNSEETTTTRRGYQNRETLKLSAAVAILHFLLEEGWMAMAA